MRINKKEKKDNNYNQESDRTEKLKKELPKEGEVGEKIKKGGK